MSSTPDPQRNTDSSKQQASSEERLAALEVRVEALENSASDFSEANGFWVVDALHNQRDQMPEGSVIFGGDVDAAGGSYSYQWQRPLEALTDPGMWTDSFERLSALAHPVRGAILRRLLQSSAQVSDFIEEELVTSTSTAYHHLSALSQAGWIKKSGSGTYEIAPARVIPLLTIISASEDH
ncbi:winged helix-turn-helix domain-containing protein [Corynebacterium sp.]|uniref:ArsR/SmtB family transcription factor n=1 Tax=Corynebacterium sp. TaxID=1720 RepID=UPI0028ACB849|nr:winged helix-turn-helix domain-containing protein [Corynebacterium sp.]